MPTEIVVAPVATLSEFEPSFNSNGELLISAKDADGNDISKSAMLIPASPFMLIFNPIDKNWGIISFQEFPKDYQLVKVITGVE